MVATPRLIQINTGFTGDASLLLSNNANTGGVYRVDRADDLDWLYDTFGDHLP